MAKGKTVSRIKTFFALLGVVGIFVVYGLVTGWNPLPGWAAWLRQQTATQLSDPRPPWTVRAGDQPNAAVVLDGAIVVTSDGSVEAHDPRNGDVMWRRRDSWAAVAGGDVQHVVVVGRTADSGFDVYDARSGVLLWKDDFHDGVWPYADMVLVLHCDGACQLAALDPVTGHPAWTAPFPTAGASLRGFDHAFAALVPLDSGYAAAVSAAPMPAPALIGLSAGGTVHVISTRNGHEVQHFPSDTHSRAVVAGSVVLVSTAVKQDQTCYSTVTARDAHTGAQLWQRSGLDPGTVSGSGCEEGHDPRGGGDTLLTVDQAGRDTLVSVDTGAVLYRAPTGEHVVATDSDVALVRSKDGKLMRVVELDSGRELYDRPVGASALIGLTPQLVLVADPAGTKPHIVAYERITGSVHLDLSSSATVLGVGQNALIINIGRSFGAVTLTAPA